MKTKTLLLFTALLASTSILAAPPETCEDLYKKGYVSKKYPKENIEKFPGVIHAPLKKLVDEGKMTRLQANSYYFCFSEAFADCQPTALDEQYKQLQAKYPDAKDYDKMKSEGLHLCHEYKEKIAEMETRCSDREGITIEPVSIVSKTIKCE